MATLLVALATAVGGQAPGALADTPTLGRRGYHCQTSPRVCRTNWAGPNTRVGFYNINNTTGQRPTWRFGIEKATNRWEVAPGPQYMRLDNTGGLAWNYFEFSFNGDHGNGPGILATTWSCTDTGYCTYFDEPVHIKWASMWLNASVLDGSPSDVFDWTATHELGHAMGLSHNTVNTRPSVMAPAYNSTNRRNIPHGDDIGSTNWCGFSPPGGLRCIYRSNGDL